MRPGMLFGGIGLAVLWVAGLAADATKWLVWPDLAAALTSLAVVAMRPPSATRPARPPNGGEMGSEVELMNGDGAPPDYLLAAPFLIAGGLAMLWLFGLALAAEPWLAWANFGFGIAYGLFGVGIGTRLERARRTRAV